MDVEEVREYCLNKYKVTEGFPFDNETLVFKVLGKMFCLLNLSNHASINLKCKPERAIELREEFDEIKPGFHMNKKHWNTVDLEGTLLPEMITKMIDDSYNLVVDNLPQKERLRIKQK